jgi:hypothetical protein
VKVAQGEERMEETMRVALALLLMFAAVPAWAQWVKMNEKDDAIHYIDRSTITKNGEMRRVWVTQYLREKGSDGEILRRAFLEYDCAGRRFRYLSTAKPSVPMLGGQTLSLQGTKPQGSGDTPVPIDEKTVQRIVCAP